MGLNIAQNKYKTGYQYFKRHPMPAHAEFTVVQKLEVKQICNKNAN